MDTSTARTTITADEIIAVFASAGLRNTRPRQVIAQQLAEHAASGTDFATDDLWQQLQGNSGVGRATLFRAVDLLVDLGVLDRIEVADGARRYRVCAAGHHHHLICTQCRRIEEIDVSRAEGELAHAVAKTGFELEWHALEFYGRCANCR